MHNITCLHIIIEQLKHIAITINTWYISETQLLTVTVYSIQSFQVHSAAMDLLLAKELSVLFVLDECTTSVTYG